MPNSRMGHGDCLYGLLRFEHTYGIESAQGLDLKQALRV